MQAQLTATDIACRRGDRLLFKGLSLACGPGDAIQITGANGVGKSSLIRIIAGLLRPFSGKVESTGTMGLVDERLALDENLPLGKALAFWQNLDGCCSPANAFAILQLEPLLDVPVRLLSTGQRKRAAIARLLNRGCQIWLLDEPLNGLDDHTRRNFEALVALHCGGGGIAVVASHQKIALPGSTVVAIEEYAV